MQTRHIVSSNSHYMVWYTYGIEKNHALVHDLQIVGHEVEIIIKFLD